MVGAMNLLVCGGARHNVANALAAIGAGPALGFPEEAVHRALEQFESTPAATLAPPAT